MRGAPTELGSRPAVGAVEVDRRGGEAEVKNLRVFLK